MTIRIFSAYPICDREKRVMIWQGKLQINVVTIIGNRPVAGAGVRVYVSGNPDNVLYELVSISDSIKKRSASTGLFFVFSALALVRCIKTYAYAKNYTSNRLIWNLFFRIFFPVELCILPFLP